MASSEFVLAYKEYKVIASIKKLTYKTSPLSQCINVYVQPILPTSTDVTVLFIYLHFFFNNKNVLNLTESLNMISVEIQSLFIYFQCFYFLVSHFRLIISKQMQLFIYLQYHFDKIRMNIDCYRYGNKHKIYLFHFSLQEKKNLKNGD